MAQDGFATAAAFVLAREGGFVNHPADADAEL
jgi:lysozyme family protein